MMPPSLMSRFSGLRRSAIEWINFSYSLARELQPRRREQRAIQAAVEKRLAALAETPRVGRRPFGGKILIDGMWYNPNYWYRLAIFRAAVGAAAGEEVGLLGRYSARRSRSSFKQIGINKVASFPGLAREARRKAASLADANLRTTKCAADILDWQLPMGFPAVMVYDGLLKYQRKATVDIQHRDFRSDAVEAFANCLAAETLIEREKPSLVLLSHPVHLSYAAVGWAAMKRNIPTVVLFGNYGVPRFARLSSEADFFDWGNTLSAEEIDALPDPLAKSLEDVGKAYLARRLAGQTNDLGAQLAYGKADRQSLRGAGQGPARGKPAVAVYASNWFDFPHGCGMTNFRDFRDWLELTIRAAIDNDRVNWLFKPHPADAWYGGVTLSDLLPDQLPPHIKVLPLDVASTEVIAEADAIVTVHSTAGLEFASKGKPVLLADRGWYDRSGIALVAKSRADYAEKLQQAWWTEIDRDLIKRRSFILAATYFCAPDWQTSVLTGDDFNHNALWAPIARILDERETLDREIGLIAEWMNSGSSRYHNFKMMHERYHSLSNVTSSAA